jgi:diacylglycerol kinase (ATP)
MQSIEKSEILFIINAKTGTRKTSSIIQSIKNKELHYRITRNLIDLENVMAEEFNNFKVFVAVGGDGTVNSLAKYLINNKQKTLAVLPVGSGNGFAYDLGFHHDIESLIQHISAGNILEIDVLSINDSDFINVAGIGLDAEVAHRFQKNKKRGAFNYVISAFISFLKFRPFGATIINEDFEISDTFLMISIANTRQWGINALISPGSIPYDGQYEIAMIKPFSFLNGIPLIYKLFKGSLKNSKYIKYIPCKEVSTINTDCKKYHVDGDPMISLGSYELKIKKNHLNVIKIQPH